MSVKQYILISMSFFFCYLQSTVAQNQEVELISQVNMTANGNDIWGYTDEEGREYAFVGNRLETVVYNMSDPENPTVVGAVPGAFSVWRDIKSYKNYAYATTDSGSDGLLVINLDHLPDSISHSFYKPFITIGDRASLLGACHNLYVDDIGFAYLSGCQRVGNGQILIFDLNQNPTEPPLVAVVGTSYSHDAYVNGNLLFSSDIFRGHVSVYDVTDRTDPQLITTAPTTGNFTHNTWTDDDANYMFTTDEVPNGSINAFDIRDLDNPIFIDEFRTENSSGNGTIPHNTHYRDGFLVTSWYSDGIIILDAHRPDNLVLVGQYDTFSGPHGGFNGNWGAFPFFDSGLVALSDIQAGFLIVKPSYRRASYLEATFINDETGEVVRTVEVTSSDTTVAASDLEVLNGELKTGFLLEGEAPISIRSTGYETIDTMMNFSAGEVSGGVIRLKPLPSKSFTVQIVDSETGSAIEEFYLSSVSSITSMRTEQQNNGNLSVIQGETMEVTVGKWGYKTFYNTIQFENENPIRIELEAGIEDDFEFDYNWTLSGSDPNQKWVRGTPNGVINSRDSLFYQPDADSPGDMNSFAYIVNNRNELTTFLGTSSLTSPPLDFSSYDPNKTQLELEYDVWFYSQAEPDSNAYMAVSILSKTDTIELERLLTQGEENQWSQGRQFTVDLDEFSNRDSLYIQITAHNILEVNIVGAGFDHFRLEPTLKTSTPEIEVVEDPFFYPNPVSNKLYTRSDQFDGPLVLFNNSGQRVLTGSLSEINDQLSIISLGAYYLQFKTKTSDSYQYQKIIKQ